MQYSYAILALAAIATGANAVTIADIPACAVSVDNRVDGNKKDINLYHL